MKKIYILLLLIISVTVYSQTDGLNYQAVILNPNTQELPGVDASNNILPNKTIAIRFTIINENGINDYQERQITTTDAYGMINLFIGEGAQTSSNQFNEISWNGKPKNLKVDIDFEGGFSFTSLSVQKLTFVPYAFHRNIIATGSLNVDGFSTFNNDFFVEGETTLNNDLTVIGNTIIESNIDVLGNSTINEDLTVNGLTNLNNEFNVNNVSPSNLTGTLNVDGETDLNAALNVNNTSSTNLTGTLNVDGKTDLNAALSVNNASSTNLTGTLNVDGESDLNAAFRVNNTSSTHLTGTLNVDGETDLNAALNVNNTSSTNLTGTLNVDGETDLNAALSVNNASPSTLSGTLDVTGITNLEAELRVSNASATILSGTLQVDGISTFNSDFTIEGNTIMNSELQVNNNAIINGQLYVENETTIQSDLNVDGNTVIANLIVRGGNDIQGGLGANHIALFENTNPDNTDFADGIAIRINGNASDKIGFRNRFITFYGNEDYVAGRIESYDLLAGDFWEAFPIPSFENIFNVFNFQNVMTGGELPTLNITSGTLPTAYLYEGKLPELDISFDFDDGLDVDFDNGYLPRLDFTQGSFPITTFNTGSFPTLNFDGFYNPQPLDDAGDEIGAMVGWGLRNGSPGYLPSNHFSLAMVPLVLAAKQIAMNQGVIYGSKGADYAEWLEKEDLTDIFVFGEVVGVKGGKISRITEGADQVMSISLAPIVLGNMPDENRKKDFEKVGFMGQVPVLTLGNVAIGDYIVASGYNDGYAKAISSEDLTLKDLKTIIGKAWSSSNGNKVSLINVSVGLKTNEWVEILKQQDQRLKELESKVDVFKTVSDRLEKLEAKITNLEVN